MLKWFIKMIKSNMLNLENYFKFSFKITKAHPNGKLQNCNLNANEE